MSTDSSAPTLSSAEARFLPPEPGADASARLRAWLEVDAGALAENLRQVRRALEGAATPGKVPALLPMVKADAYGLGSLQAVEALRPVGVAGWGVATVDEALLLRGAGVREPIQVFSPLLPEDLLRALEAGVIPSISDPRLLEVLPPEAEGAFEVEVDTGMGRAGIGLPALDGPSLEGWAEPLVAKLAGGRLRWEGIFTHLHSADEEEGVARQTVLRQVERFRAGVEVLDRVRAGRGLPPLRTHVANSAGALRFPELVAGFHQVRPGIALYGGTVGSGPPLFPVVSVRARVVRIVEVEPGTTAGYGATYRAARRERWATLAIGYGDGLPRALSGRGFALVSGERVPMVGRISMDMTVVDVTDVPTVEVGAVATLVGRDGPREITLAEMAEAVGTIHYEILTGWSRRLPRLWTSGGPTSSPGGVEAR